MDYINLFALIVVPIAAVLIGQHLQDRSKKRDDKMAIFKTLMTSRIYGWSVESVNALNVIDIVFSDDKRVLDCWKNYYDTLCIPGYEENNVKKRQIARDNLLEAMAISLGYKDKITWQTIQNPYMPEDMFHSIVAQKQFQNDQIELMKRMMSNLPNAEEKPHEQTKT